MTGPLNTARLLTLGVLAAGGPTHGYRIGRAIRTGWNDLKPGSLYYALHRMAQDGLVEVVRRERDGNTPERTVYAITGKGRRELEQLRDAALRDVRLSPDPIDLALLHLPDLTGQELEPAVRGRRQAIAAALAAVERDYADAAPGLAGLAPMAYEHAVARLRTELGWHDDVLHRLAAT